MLVSKELTALIVIDVKGFEGTKLLTKCAHHLAELGLSNASEYI